MKTKFFPTPQEFPLHPATPQPVVAALFETRSKLESCIFEFKPTYQTSRYFNEVASVLRESNWALSLEEGGVWKIQPSI